MTVYDALDNYDETKLFHPMSKTLPVLGSKGYFFNSRTEAKKEKAPLHLETLTGVEPIFQRYSTEWDWYNYFYLISTPEEEAKLYRPFQTREEARSYLGCVIADSKRTYIITGLFMHDDLLMVTAGKMVCSSRHLLEEGWQLDGRPFGVLKENGGQMKTEREAEHIASFLETLSSSSIIAGDETLLKYDNASETVMVRYRAKQYQINVAMDSVDAVYRDVIRGLAKIVDGKGGPYEID